MKPNIIRECKIKQQWYRSVVYLFGLIIAMLWFDSRAFAANQYAVFTLNSDFQQLSNSKARMLYRGKAKSLQGKRIELSDWPESSVERSEFYQYLLGKDIAQMNAYWAGLSFAGKARPPKEIHSASLDSLIVWMEAKPNRIGYAPLNAVPAEAKVLYVVSKEK